MAKTKRIFREWQHPRASNGRFAKKGSPEWVKAAAEKFRNAPDGLKAGTSAPGHPGRPRIARGAKAEAALAAHDASVTTRLAPHQPVQGPAARPASTARKQLPRTSKEWRVTSENTKQREKTLRALAGGEPTAAEREKARQENLMRGAGSAVVSALDKAKVATRRDSGQTGGVTTTTLSAEQRANYDKLLGNGPGEGLVKHKQSRQIVEQLEQHGWTPNGNAPEVGLLSFKAPDGREIGVQFLTGQHNSKPRFFTGGAARGRDLSYKAALAHVVTPRHEAVGGGGVSSARERLGLPDIRDNYSDHTLKPFRDALQAHTGYGTMHGPTKNTSEVATDLRKAAESNRRVADHRAEYNRGIHGASYAEDSSTTLLRQRADEFEAVAAEMEKMDRERAAYVAERDRRAGLPLDIRPTHRTGSAKPAKKTAVADLTSDAPRRIVKGGNLEADKPSESEIEQRYAKADAAIKARKAREAAAAEQGPALGPDLAQSPGAASMASIKNATIGGTGGGARDYDKMDRATLNILARDARIPIAQRRGKSNGELAALLRAKDEENKAKKAAKLNPSGVGEPSTQHETHIPARAVLSDAELRSILGNSAPGSVAAMDAKGELDARRLGIPPGPLPDRSVPADKYNWEADMQARADALIAQDRRKARNRQLDVGNLPADRGTRKGGYTPWNREGQGGRITVSGDARTRAASPAGLYDRHKGLTREQFDALPETRQRTVLDELRKAVASNEQVSHTIASNRSGFHGATLRGTKDAPHVEGARNKLRELTYTAPPPIDNSIEGRAARLKAGDRYAADGTIEELNQIARAAGFSGFPASWKRQKGVDYLRNQAIAGDRMRAARDGNLSSALRGASPAEAMAVMEARDAEYGVTLGEIGTAAKVLGVKLPAGDKRKRMHALAQGAGERSSAPKAEAAKVAAPGSDATTKTPTAWIDKATGREVTNPGQVGIVRGDIVKADSDVGKAAVAARAARTARPGEKVDTRRDKVSTGGASKSPTTEANVSEAKRTGEPQLGVTESSRGRTTTVTLPDGTTAQRTSKTMTYSYAVVGTTDEHANARDARQLADRLDAYTAALEAWIAGGSDMSKLKKFDTGTGSYNDAQAGIKHYGYYLPGFEPKQVRTKSGMTYYQSNPDGPTVEYRDLYRDGTLVPTRPGYEKFHGPAAHQEVLDRARKQAKNAREEAAKLEAGPRYSYHVPRWSQRADTAFSAIGSPEVNRQNTSYQVVTVGGIAKEDTRPAKVVPTLAEKAAAAEARKVADKAASAARTQQFFDEKVKGITDSLSGVDSHDPEWHLQMTTEAGLVSLAKHLKVKVANRRQSEYGPRPRNQEEIAKIRQDIVQAVRDRQPPAAGPAVRAADIKKSDMVQTGGDWGVVVGTFDGRGSHENEVQVSFNGGARKEWIPASSITAHEARPSANAPAAERVPRSEPFNPRVANGGNLPPKREGETDGMYNIRVAPTDDAAEKQLRGYSIAGLKAILRDAGLPTGGTKDQLVERAMGPRRRYWDSIGIERRGSSPKA